MVFSAIKDKPYNWKVYIFLLGIYFIFHFSPEIKWVLWICRLEDKQNSSPLDGEKEVMRLYKMNIEE